jgi:hypothetical protein
MHNQSLPHLRHSGNAHVERDRLRVLEHHLMNSILRHRVPARLLAHGNPRRIASGQTVAAAAADLASARTMLVARDARD